MRGEGLMRRFCVFLAVGVVCLAIGCRGRTISKETAIGIAFREASKQETPAADVYDTAAEFEHGEWVVKFKPKQHGKGGSIWVHVNAHTGEARAVFWQ
jgi:hypothetical protein